MNDTRLAGGFGFPLGCAGAVAAVIAADLAGATGHPWYALVTLGLVVLVAGFWTTARAAAGVAVVAWALHAGFVVGREGQLAFDGASAVAAVVFGAALALGLLAGTAARAQRPVRVPAPRRPVDVPAPRDVRAAG